MAAYLLYCFQVTPLDFFPVLFGDRIGWTLYGLGSDVISFSWVNQSQTLYRPVSFVNNSFVYPMVDQLYIFNASMAYSIQPSVAIMLEPSKCFFYSFVRSFVRPFIVHTFVQAVCRSLSLTAIAFSLINQGSQRRS